MGASPGSTCSILYNIANFLKSLCSFVVRSFSSWVPLQLLDVCFACFTDISDFASSGTLFSSFLLTNLYFSLSFYTCFHSFIICRVYKFSYLGANACLAENADIVLLSHFCFKLLLAFLLFYSGVWSFRTAAGVLLYILFVDDHIWLPGCI